MDAKFDVTEYFFDDLVVREIELKEVRTYSMELISFSSNLGKINKYALCFPITYSDIANFCFNFSNKSYSEKKEWISKVSLDELCEIVLEYFQPSLIYRSIEAKTLNFDDVYLSKDDLNISNKSVITFDENYKMIYPGENLKNPFVSSLLTRASGSYSTVKDLRDNNIDYFICLLVINNNAILGVKLTKFEKKEKS